MQLKQSQSCLILQTFFSWHVTTTTQVDQLINVNIVQACMNGITLLDHASAEFERKRKNNLRNIVHKDFSALCGPKPRSAACKAKPRNTRSKYLLGDNLKQAAKDAKRSEKSLRKIPIERTLKRKVSIIHQLIRKNLF